MSNRWKTREERLRQTLRNNAGQTQKAQRELDRIEMLKAYAELKATKENGHGG